MAKHASDRDSQETQLCNKGAKTRFAYLLRDLVASLSCSLDSTTNHDWHALPFLKVSVVCHPKVPQKLRSQ